MNSSSLPFFVGGVRVGIVNDITDHPGFSRGRLSLEVTETYDVVRRFNAVICLAKLVDASTADKYQECWGAWSRGCRELQDLNLWVGNSEGPVEGFSIESDWTIEWQKYHS